MLGKHLLCMSGTLLAVLIIGCSGNTGPTVTLAEAGGVVKYKGGPLAGASVVFVPDKGPIAMGVTDMEGKFVLSTGGSKGVAVGDCKISISVGGSGGTTATPAFDSKTAPSSQEEGMARKKAFEDSAKAMMMRTGKDAKSTSLIPERYADNAKSGLKQTITTDKSKNQFVLELTD